MGHTFIVGSSLNSDVVVNEDGISRRHLQVQVLSYEQVVLTDLDSRFGSAYYCESRQQWFPFSALTVPLETFVQLGGVSLYLLEIFIARRVQLKNSIYE